MALQAKVLTEISIPEEIEVEVSDSITGNTTIRRVNLPECFHELGVVDFQEAPPEEVLEMAFALARHRAIDGYLRSLGIDPHEHIDAIGRPEDEPGL